MKEYSKGEAIRIIREWTNLTQKEFAKQIGKAKRTVEQYEAGFDKKQISKNLIMYRKKLNKSQSTIAEDIHVNQSTVSMWENNSINIQIDSLKSLAKVFNISIDKLVGIE